MLHSLVGGHQHRSAFVLHQEHEEFRRFGLARISPNDVNIIGAFIEALTRCQNRDQRRCHYDPGEHAALVLGNSDADDRVLRSEHRKLGNSHKEAQKPQNAFVNLVPFRPGLISAACRPAFPGWTGSD